MQTTNRALSFSSFDSDGVSFNEQHLSHASARGKMWTGSDTERGLMIKCKARL